MRKCVRPELYDDDNDGDDDDNGDLWIRGPIYKISYDLS